MILFNGVWFSYNPDTPVLQNLCLQLRPGEVVGLMGENGAGKTTLVKHINGLLKPNRGAVYVDGVDTRNTSTANLARKVGFVFQNADHQLFADTLNAEVGFALRNLNFSKEEIQTRVSRFLELFELSQYEEQSPFLLSGGERKRLALASVLCVEPKILILDEPTQAQDALQKQKLLDFIDSFRSPEHIVLVVTHDVEFAVKAVDRLVVLSHGQLIADGSPGDILRNPLILKRARLLPPQLTQFAYQLAEHLPQFPTNLTTVPEAVDAVNQLLRRRR
ncbi:MAG: energy-coupling factor ABC transporter ATP-binding protein [Candidatus Thorarchaeota archaeon]